MIVGNGKGGGRRAGEVAALRGGGEGGIAVVAYNDVGSSRIPTGI